MGDGKRLSIPKISIIMLTYNREAMLSTMIECILSQTYTNFEYIIIDNGSTDDSGKIADEYARHDNRICVIHRNKESIGSGRNAGIDVAVGDWLTFVDDDDACEPDFLEYLYHLANEDNADIAICGADKFENDSLVSNVLFDKKVMNTEEALIELLWRKRYNNGFPTKLFKRVLFEDLRFPKDTGCDDIHLMYKVIAKAKCIVSSCIPKYHVCRHGANNSIATTVDGKITPEYLSEYRMAYRERTKWLTERYSNLESMWRYFEQSFLVSMVHKVITNDLMDCQDHFIEMCHELSGQKEEFINCPWSQESEKEWMKGYIPYE